MADAPMRPGRWRIDDAILGATFERRTLGDELARQDHADQQMATGLAGLSGMAGQMQAMMAAMTAVQQALATAQATGSQMGTDITALKATDTGLGNRTTSTETAIATLQSARTANEARITALESAQTALQAAITALQARQAAFAALSATKVTGAAVVDVTLLGITLASVGASRVNAMQTAINALVDDVQSIRDKLRTANLMKSS